jgi:complement component 1 Q subcomponent-binding protein
MLSIRSFARSAPRAVSRLTSSAIRTPTIRQASLIQSWKPSTTRYAAAFSTSSARREKSAEGDEELVAKLDAEISMENEMKENDGIPTSVKDYVENSPFEIIDVPGEEDVVLTRKFGDES